ncbi:RNase H domain-containing protein [Trichonephila clavipes]|nr:RNase H domain-containing protein [Trichonephila clavipes]
MHPQDTKTTSLSHQIHFQWIPSHVDITGNEISDILVRAGAGETTPAAPLTYLELVSNSRRDQTALARFLSGHLLSVTFVDGIKLFENCIKFSSAQACPGHILSCLRLTRQDMVQDTLLVMDFFRVNGLMDLI